MGLKNRTTEEWLELYKKQRESGKPPKMWCEENGVNVYTFADRMSRLRKAGLIEKKKPPGRKYSSTCLKIDEQKPTTNEMPPWVELLSSKEENEIKEIEIVIGKFQIKLKSDFCEKTFLRASKVLVSLC